MNRGQFVSLILSFAFLGVQIVWAPALAEEVENQEQDISLYLYTWNGGGRLTTIETGGNGDQDQIGIQPGSSAFFALNYSLQADLPVKSYRTGVGFHLYLYANSADFSAGHLNLYVRDGTTMTGGDLLASGDMNIPTVIQTNNEEHVDIYWEDGLEIPYHFPSENYIVLELENDGTNAVNVELDSGKSGDSPSRLISTTNPVRDITVLTQSYDLESPNAEALIDTENFKPNLPSTVSKMFVSGTALNAFGTYDITNFKVEVLDSEDDSLFVDQVEVDEPDEETGTNEFEDIVWNYNDPAEPSENHNGKGTYTVRVSVTNQQGNEFSFDKSITMDALGAYLYTSEPNQNVAVGGSVEYQIFVMNSGDENDEFTVEPSATSDSWVVSPTTWTSGTLAPGQEQVVTFMIEVDDSAEMVGDKAPVIFTAQQEKDLVGETFGLLTETTVGAEYKVALYFEDESTGQPTAELDTISVAGDWNQYILKVINQGQAKDAVQLLAPDVPVDWEVKFEPSESGELSSDTEPGEYADYSITVENIFRLGDGDHIANVTVWAKPAQGGDIETAAIELIGISQGNTSQSSEAILNITRSFGLALSPTSKIFPGKEAGEQFEFELLLESFMEGEHTITLKMNDEFPVGWSSSFKDEGGATVTEIPINKDVPRSLKLSITVGSQAAYIEDGYSFKAVAQDLNDQYVIARQDITVILKLDTGFTLSSLKSEETLKPGESYTFQLTIQNNANGQDEFTLSASSVPSGWRVVFPDGSNFKLDSQDSTTVPIQITVGDEAKNGEEETVVISVVSALSSEQKPQNFVIEVKESYGGRLTSAFTELWYLVVFLGLIIVIGTVTYYRQEYDDWDEDYSDSDDDTVPKTVDSSDDEWDDWN